jgi:hypothetical protein
MQASVRRVGLTYAALAAVFIGSALSIFALITWLVPAKPGPRPPIVIRAVPPPPATAHRRKAAHLSPDEHAAVGNQLMAVSVHCRISDAFPFNEPREITLTLELGERGDAADLANPRPCSTEPQTLWVGGGVSASLSGPPDVLKLAPADEKRYVVTPAAPVRWTWYVTPLEPGTFNAEIILSTELRLADKVENIQLWTPPQKIAVEFGFFNRIGYAIDWVSRKSLVSSLVTALFVTVATAILGAMRGWFGFLFRRKPKDAQATT